MQVRVYVAPVTAAPLDVETAIWVDGAPEPAGVLLGQPRVELWLLHFNESTSLPYTKNFDDSKTQAASATDAGAAHPRQAVARN